MKKIRIRRQGVEAKLADAICYLRPEISQDVIKQILNYNMLTVSQTAFLFGVTVHRIHYLIKNKSLEVSYPFQIVLPKRILNQSIMADSNISDGPQFVLRDDKFTTLLNFYLKSEYEKKQRQKFVNEDTAAE